MVVWAGWALIRLLGLDRGALLVPLISFTPWMALAAPIPIVVALVLRRRAAAITAAVVAAVFAALVLPRAFGGPSEAAADGGPSLRVLAANVEFGRASPGAVVELVRELDVDALALEELTPRFATALRQEGLAELLPYEALAAGPAASGTGLYARDPFRSRSGAPLPGGFNLARATIDPAAAPAVELVAVHTVPPTWGATSWDDDLAALPGTSEAPLRVLLGDFNATVDHEAFRDVVDRGYDDAAEVLGEGLTFTWPVGRRILPAMVAIDHVLADERIGIADFSAHQLAHTDHRAVYAELVLPPG